MATSSRLSHLLSPLARARLAVYGTLGLCGYVSFATYSVQSQLAEAARTNNTALWNRSIRQRDGLEKTYVCSRRNLSEGRYYTLVTSIFNHGSAFHLLGNMLGLWSFGRVIAYGFGARTFLALFYGGGVLGNALCLGLDKRFGERAGGDGKSVSRQKRETGGFIGASGGVCAIVAANACLNPWGKMIVGIMFIPVPVPNVIGALGFAGFSVWAQTNNFQANVAHMGHLGGLACGLLWFVARFRGLPVL